MVKVLIYKEEIQIQKFHIYLMESIVPILFYEELISQLLIVMVRFLTKIKHFNSQESVIKHQVLLL